jgi:hypothetical protein
MTRADSLAIAAALREELARLDPEAARKAPVTAPTAPTAPGASVDQDVAVVSLDRQLMLVDSMVRIRLAQITSRDGAAAALAEAERAAARVGVTTRPGSTERKSVLVVSQGVRGNDSALAQLGSEVAREISSRLGRSPQWSVVPPETVERGDRELPAEVLVTVGASRVPGDSAMLRIAVRNLTPGSTFGFNVVTSKHVAIADGARGARTTIGQAMEVLGDLRRLDRGEVWTFDMGRGTRGPTMDQLRTLDSMRRNVPRPPEPDEE